MQTEVYMADVASVRCHSLSEALEFLNAKELEDGVQFVTASRDKQFGDVGKCWKNSVSQTIAWQLKQEGYFCGQNHIQLKMFM
jgi:acyl-CoA reductase-like NAD-dependent aldehyde dehydrogenase